MTLVFTESENILKTVKNNYGNCLFVNSNHMAKLMVMIFHN